jgi:cytidine deaminase
MKKVSYLTEFTVYQNLDELDEGRRQLIETAVLAAETAYSPYSHFSVGAAVLLNNGQVIAGSNQENAAYPSGLCAERTAAFYASSQYSEVPFSKIAITTINEVKKGLQPLTPCGACRQVLLEYEQRFNQNIELILTAPNAEIYIFASVKDILPFSFGSDDLNAK